MKKRSLVRATAILSITTFFVTLSLVNKCLIREALAKEVVVKIGATMDQTGVIGPQGRKMVTTIRWFEEYVNEELGGWKDLEGNTVKIKFLVGDTGFKPGPTLSLYKKYKAEGVVAVAQIGSVEVAAVRSAALRDKMPLPTNSGALVYPLPSPCNGNWTDYSACSAAVIDYVKEKWEKSDAPWTKKRRPRLALVGPEGYPSWSACITPEVMRYAKLQGVEVVGKFFIKFIPMDTKPQIMSAKKAKADFIYTGMVVMQGGVVCRDLYDLGLRGDPTKKEGKIEIIGLFPMSPLLMIKLAGGRYKAVEGMRLIGSHAYVLEDQPSLRIIRKYAKKYNLTDTLDVSHVCFWYVNIRIGEAIRLALQKVPGDKLKRGDVWDAFLKIKDFDTGGIVPSKITINEEERIGMKKVRVDEIVGKKGVRRLLGYTDYKMLAPIYTKEYAKAHGKKSIYSDKTLKILNLKAEDVGYKRIKE